MLTGQILLQLIIILITVQISGYLCRCIGQQWVIGEIVAGLILGPSLLGGLFPGTRGFFFPASALPTLQTLGDIGLILYMFSLGACLDVHLMVRQSRKAIAISASGILLPLVLGGMLADLLFPTLKGPEATLVSFILMVGTAMSITAFPVLARLLTERKLLGTRIGVLALTCAAVDDVAAWCLLALVIAVVHAQNLSAAMLTVGLTILFIICMLTIVRPLLAYIDQRIRSKQLLVALCIVLLLLSAYCTNAIGIHPVFGAFLMGTILPRRVVLVELVQAFDRVNYALFLPLYFVYSGLRTQVGLISTPWLWLICLVVLLVACAGKILGGTCTMRFLGEPWRGAFVLGILMNTRGLVELIVLNIGLDTGVLSPTIFAMLVIMALTSTMMAAPLLLLLGYPQNGSKEADENILMPSWEKE
ncbi:MAG: cation:proton antiporter [Ktedonobacteraceae bacterium]|nr:cation:proton antiporter [Ktedonobacteraceae bacterium]